MRYLLFIPLLLNCYTAPNIKREPNSLDQTIHQAEIIVGHIPSPENILLIGDSEVLYEHYYFDQANVKLPNETIFFNSKPGTTILTWNNIFVSEMNRFPNVDTVIIYLGTNNQNFKFLQPHQNILDEVKRRNLKCIWVGNTKVYNRHHMINDLVHQAVEPTCTYFDTEKADIELIDGVHPTKSGSIKWLQMVWRMKNDK